MGLSRMGDEIGLSGDNLTITDLYRHRGYIDPEYENWENWFAWRPVRRIIRAPQLYPDPITYKWEWMTNLLRRRVRSRYFFSSKDREKEHWEYTTMLEILRWG